MECVAYLRSDLVEDVGHLDGRRAGERGIDEGTTSGSRARGEYGPNQLVRLQDQRVQSAIRRRERSSRRGISTLNARACPSMTCIGVACSCQVARALIFFSMGVLASAPCAKRRGWLFCSGTGASGLVASLYLQAKRVGLRNGAGRMIALATEGRGESGVLPASAQQCSSAACALACGPLRFSLSRSPTTNNTTPWQRWRNKQTTTATSTSRPAGTLGSLVPSCRHALRQPAHAPPTCRRISIGLALSDFDESLRASACPPSPPC